MLWALNNNELLFQYLTAGYYASECICENERYCDGAVLQPDTRSCVAYRIDHGSEPGSPGVKVPNMAVKVLIPYNLSAKNAVIDHTHLLELVDKVTTIFNSFLHGQQFHSNF